MLEAYPVFIIPHTDFDETFKCCWPLGSDDCLAYLILLKIFFGTYMATLRQVYGSVVAWLFSIFGFGHMRLHNLVRVTCERYVERRVVLWVPNDLHINSPDL